ncbi:hypothetical protein BaRGS_00002591 [Batillaria attramentaria]|uniref:Uncharacterized protein n=1 Tax=Batillaria attramentaria TaxID=370345 RepID=A0ABD0M3K4_9CAEN
MRYLLAALYYIYQVRQSAPNSCTAHASAQFPPHSCLTYATSYHTCPTRLKRMRQRGAHLRPLTICFDLHYFLNPAGDIESLWAPIGISSLTVPIKSVSTKRKADRREKQISPKDRVARVDRDRCLRTVHDPVTAASLASAAPDRYRQSRARASAACPGQRTPRDKVMDFLQFFLSLLFQLHRSCGPHLQVGTGVPELADQARATNRWT